MSNAVTIMQQTEELRSGKQHNLQTSRPKAAPPTNTPESRYIKSISKTPERPST